VPNAGTGRTCYRPARRSWDPRSKRPEPFCLPGAPALVTAGRGRACRYECDESASPSRTGRRPVKKFPLIPWTFSATPCVATRRSPPRPLLPLPPRRSNGAPLRTALQTRFPPARTPPSHLRDVHARQRLPGAPRYIGKLRRSLDFPAVLYYGTPRRVKPLRTVFFPFFCSWEPIPPGSERAPSTNRMRCCHSGPVCQVTLQSRWVGLFFLTTTQRRWISWRHAWEGFVVREVRAVSAAAPT